MNITINDKKPVIAIDLGGTKIMTALFNATGKLVDRDVCPTLAANGYKDVIDRMGQNVQELLKRNNLKPEQTGAITIAAAGGIDTGRGVAVTPSPHLPDWKDIPIAAMFKDRFGIDTYVLNDASAAALGVHRYGTGKGVKHLVLLTLGTGIGGGIIIDGEWYLGASGGAGELGHMTVEARGPKCGCGNTGCLEMYASSRGIVMTFGEIWSQQDAAAPLRTGITSEQVYQAARSGEPIAVRAMQDMGRSLGIGIANLINIFNPEMVVIGGGVRDAWDLFIDATRDEIRRRAFEYPAERTKILPSVLGDDAGMVGAAAVALQKIEA